MGYIQYMTTYTVITRKLQNRQATFQEYLSAFNVVIQKIALILIFFFLTCSCFSYAHFFFVYHRIFTQTPSGHLEENVRQILTCVFCLVNYTDHCYQLQYVEKGYENKPTFRGGGGGYSWSIQVKKRIVAFFTLLDKMVNKDNYLP